MCQTVASYSSISGCRRAIGAGLGSERSMWQRQIQLRLFSRAPRRRPIGCGSWTITVSHSPCRPSALICVDLVEDRPLLVAQGLLGPLQRVVEELGRVEELFFAEDHVPVRVEPDVAHQRHDRVEDLRDAAAEGGGADVQDALSLQRLGQLADLLGQLFAGDVGVVGEGLLAEGDFLKHARSSTGTRRRDGPFSRPHGVRAACPGSLRPSRVLPSWRTVSVTFSPGLVGGDVGERGRRGDHRRGRRRRGSCRRRPGSAGLEAELAVAALQPRLGPPGRRGRLRRAGRRRSVSRPSLAASCG